MRMMSRLAVLSGLLIATVAAPAAGQNYRWDFGVNGGGSWYRSMLDADETNMPDDSDVDNVKFRAGWLVGSQLGVWLRPNLGLRANLTYTDRPVVYENNDLLSGPTSTVGTLDNVNLWSGSVDLMWRFRQPNTDWMGTETLPYLALGLGGKWVNPAGDRFNCVDAEEGKNWSCEPFTVGTPPVNGGTFALGEQKVLMGLVGLGTDVRFAPNWALRLEVNDRIYRPQIYRAAAPLAGGDVHLPAGDKLVGHIVHEVGAQIGLHMLMGLQRAQVVTVAPAPAPAPPPTPTPPPAPVEEAITVCVIDPTTSTGLRTQNAFYRVEQRDTVVMVGGERVPLRRAVGTVMVARDADWYVRGQPLTLTIGNERVEYLTYQGARQIEPERLAYLGRVNGYPVYADRDEVADVIDALNSLREAEASRDLGEILAERRDVRDELEDVQFLYVPLEPTGCVFQTVQRMEQVRKGK